MVPANLQDAAQASYIHKRSHDQQVFGIWPRKNGLTEWMALLMACKPDVVLSHRSSLLPDKASCMLSVSYAKVSKHARLIHDAMRRTDAHGQAAGDERALLERFVVVGAHEQGVLHGAALGDERAQAHNRVLHPGACADDAAVPQDGVHYLRILHLAGRQEARHCVDGRIFVVEAAGPSKRAVSDWSTSRRAVMVECICTSTAAACAMKVMASTGAAFATTCWPQLCVGNSHDVQMPKAHGGATAISQWCGVQNPYLPHSALQPT